MDPTKEQISSLRAAFLQDLSSKGEGVIHEKDLDRVNTDDQWLKRFLKHTECRQDDAVQMMWTSILWRKEFGANDIDESSVKMEILTSGGFFPHGQDIDGCKLFILKGKKYVKGAYPMEDIKRCVIYWFERLERETFGEPITLFFDMEGCGLSNMDMDFIRYLISLFKEYYPYFLNYILIFEMPWVLSAAFKIIKSWLPPKAVEKIKFLSKKDISTYVPLDYALKCWGGNHDYQFSFVSEPSSEPLSLNNNNRKVHFSDGSPMSEGAASDKEEGGGLCVSPPSIIKFVKEGNDLISSIVLQNNGTGNLAYKLKTTSPEKFRVRPGAGCLTPGSKTTITVTLLEGFQLGGLSKDKFLVISIPIQEAELSSQELTALYKNTSGRKVYQHHLRCAQAAEPTKNGSALVGTSTDIEQNPVVTKMSQNVCEIMKVQKQLQTSVKTTQYFQITILVLMMLLGAAITYIIKFMHEDQYCPAVGKIKSEL